MMTSLAKTLRQICTVEGAAVIALAALAVPAVAVGTMAAVLTLLMVIPALSLIATWRAARTMNQSPVLSLPASFTAGAATQFRV